MDAREVPPTCNALVRYRALPSPRAEASRRNQGTIFPACGRWCGFHAAQSIVTFWGLAYCANGARRALRRGLVVRWLWSLGRFRNRCSATELSGAADVCTVDHLHGEGLSGRAIQAAFAWRHCREHRRQVRAPGARKCFVSTWPPGNRLTTGDFSPPSPVHANVRNVFCPVGYKPQRLAVG